MLPFVFAPWSWRDPTWTAERRLEDARDAAGDGDRPDVGLIGYRVRALDGDLGEVAGNNAELPADLLVVECGSWLRDRGLVLPVGVVAGVDHEQRTIHVDRTSEQIGNAPPYDPDEVDIDDFRRRTADYYADSYRLSPPTTRAPASDR